VSGLRERKKRETRQALGVAARRLAVEHGPGNVRVADIAERAGVAPRTYNGYFASREEAICALHADRAHRVADALRARPREEPLAAAMTAALTAELLGPEPDRPALRLITGEPGLRGEFLKDLATIEAPLAAAITERLPDTPRLVVEATAAAAVAAARIALLHWLDGDEPIAGTIARALQVVRGPEPVR
jgi:AcrR family transcriptional regulator